LGNYLKENTDLVDHRGDPAYSDWEEELVEYDKLVEEMYGKSFADIKYEQEQQRKEEKKKKKSGQ
jgi:hypothetical protein